MFSDNFFKKVEKKTNVNKETILSLADKLQKGNMKDETTLKEVINDLAKMTGREVSKEKEEKIIPISSSKKTGVEDVWNEIVNQYNKHGYEVTVD